MVEILISTAEFQLTVRVDATTLTMLWQALVWATEYLAKQLFG